MVVLWFLEMIGKNLGTIAVIPASNTVPLQNFTFELGLAINDIGKCLIISTPYSFVVCIFIIIIIDIYPG